MGDRRKRHGRGPAEGPHSGSKRPNAGRHHLLSETKPVELVGKSGSGQRVGTNRLEIERPRATITR